jgi:lambda family phage portal protein
VGEIKEKSKRGGFRPGAGRPKKSLGKNAAFEAAELYQPGRTLVYMPTVDPRQELTSGTRSSLLRKARWLYNNVGLAARAVDGVARYVCGTGIIPQARSADAAWNKQAEELFEDTCGREAFGFDAAGQVNFYEAQNFIVRHVAIDGDFFGQFLKSDSGRAIVRFIGGEHVGNAMLSRAKQDEWQDGVRTDKFGRPTQYRVLTDKDGKAYQDVSADDILHFRRPARIGYTRSPSWLSRAALHLHDMADIVGFTKQTFKLASQPAFIIESPDAMNIGMGAALKKQDHGSGSVTVDKLYGQSGVMQLPPGTKLQQFKNEHPGNNFQQFIDFLARDISWGIGISPEMLWSVAGIGGANTRYVLADAQVFFSELQDWLINQFCRRFWKYWVWHEIEAGRLPLRDDWWRVDFIPPARATVDFGRDTKALLDIVRAGAMSTRRFAEMHGLDEESEEDAAIASAVRRKEKCEAAGLNVTDVFPPAPGSVVGPSGSQTGMDASGDTSNDDDADETNGGSTPPDSTTL